MHADPDPMRYYRAKRDSSRISVRQKYTILGFISSGTYGRVYKAQQAPTPSDGATYAIKKFKPDREGCEGATYSGISQSAIREMALNREIEHEHVVRLHEVMLEDRAIYMVFDYAEHDFLQLIHHHSQSLRIPIPLPVLKSLIYQLLAGLLYLHASHILHRDLKPANVLITASGTVKIGDLGLARLSYSPLQPLVAGDKVVVTIWYRAPELLLGAKHYTKAIDIWAVGCVMAELASLRPVFKGEEAKLDSKKNVPFQKDQLLKILDVLGTPSESAWPDLRHMPEYAHFRALEVYPNRLFDWCQRQMRGSQQAYELLRGMFAYDPAKRLDARMFLNHRWFEEEPRPTANAFQSLAPHQFPPHRRITQDDAPSSMVYQKPSAGSLPAHSSVGARKKQRIA